MFIKNSKFSKGGRVWVQSNIFLEYPIWCLKVHLVSFLSNWIVCALLHLECQRLVSYQRATMIFVHPADNELPELTPALKHGRWKSAFVLMPSLLCFVWLAKTITFLILRKKFSSHNKIYPFIPLLLTGTGDVDRFLCVFYFFWCTDIF